MGKRHKLIRVSEDKLRADAKDEILKLIYNRFASGRDTSLQDIQDVFQKPPFSLSEGSVINYLNELCEQRKISTWKVKNRRYYGPPKIPIQFKIGLAVTSFIIILTIAIDMLIHPKFIVDYIYFGRVDYVAGNNTPVSFTPVAVYLIFLTIFFTFLWYFINRKNNHVNEKNNRKLFK